MRVIGRESGSGVYLNKMGTIYTMLVWNFGGVGVAKQWLRQHILNPIKRNKISL